jgi:hypothetical protein
MQADGEVLIGTQAILLPSTSQREVDRATPQGQGAQLTCLALRYSSSGVALRR